MKKLSVLLTIFMLISVTVSEAATTITVGHGGGYDYGSIQTALNNATDGDTIDVAAGWYVEGTAEYYGNGSSVGLDFGRLKQVKLLGQGEDDTFVDFNGAYYGLMFENSASNNTVTGFTMFNSISRYGLINFFNGSSDNSVTDSTFGGPAEYVQDYGSGNSLTGVTLDASYIPVQAPEPTSAALLGFGGLSLMLRRRR